MGRRRPTYTATYAALPTQDEAVAEAARDRVVGLLRRLLVPAPNGPASPEGLPRAELPSDGDNPAGASAGAACGLEDAHV